MPRYGWINIENDLDTWVTNQSKSIAGGQNAFDENWRYRAEAYYNHWTRGKPANQIQLAFRNHWKLFQELIRQNGSKKCLEVGCGRGSISSYFADQGYDCTLLDISPTVLKIAEEIFKRSGHRATFVCSDANQMPFQDNQFDVVMSIGLLEHFSDIRATVKEQIRVLKKGGTFLGYIVPHDPNEGKKYAQLVNRLLKFCTSPYAKEGKDKKKNKVPLFRNHHGPEAYIKALEEENVSHVETMGVYPLPMISHSPDFPFSLLPSPLEKLLTKVLEIYLFLRRKVYGHNPWICSESAGQAFLLTFKKGTLQ